MKRINLLLIILLIGAFTMANKCTDQGWNMANLFPTPKDSICSTIPEGESFICSRLRNPEGINSALYLANAFALENMDLDGVMKEKRAVDETIAYLAEPSLTYALFQKFVLKKSNSLVAVAAAQELSMFEFNDTPILQADRNLLTLSLEKTSRLIELALIMKRKEIG